MRVCVRACMHACMRVCTSECVLSVLVSMRAYSFCTLTHMQPACRTINHDDILSVSSAVMLHSIIVGYEIWSIPLFR